MSLEKKNYFKVLIKYIAFTKCFALHKKVCVYDSIFNKFLGI